MIRVELQCFDKAFLEFREKVQRTTEKCDVPANRPSLCEVADGLVDDRLKNGEGNIRLLRAVVHERLDIRLGKHAAARGNRVDALSLLRKCIEANGVGREERCHVVDERAGTARADTIHALLGGIAEIRDLGILAAELDRRRRLRYETAHSRGTSDDLLHEGQSDALGDAHARRARERKREFCLPHDFFQLCEIILQSLADLGEMTRIVLV